jgi:hypothetical protein
MKPPAYQGAFSSIESNFLMTKRFTFEQLTEISSFIVFSITLSATHCHNIISFVFFLFKSQFLFQTA